MRSVMRERYTRGLGGDVCVEEAGFSPRSGKKNTTNPEVGVVTLLNISALGLEGLTTIVPVSPLYLIAR